MFFKNAISLKFSHGREGYKGYTQEYILYFGELLSRLGAKLCGDWNPAGGK